MDSNFERILKKKEYVVKNKSKIPTKSVEQFNKQFALEFAHESTALEGNSLTMEEVKMILELNPEQREQLIEKLKSNE